MRTGIVLMALGVVFLAQLPRLPDALLVCLLPVCMVWAWLSAAGRHLALFVCGLLWALLWAHYLLAGVLPQSLEGRTLMVDGTVVGLPGGDGRRLRFEFHVSRARHQGRALRFEGRVRLSWYQGAPTVLPGERWQLAVRLKRPRGLVNPAGLDYERWLFLRGFAATGYVRSAAGNRRTGPAGATGLNGLRHRLSHAIGEHLPDEPMAAIIKALVVGDRWAMTRAQWQILRATGTSHLMAISGLHVGLVAGLAYFLVARLWPVVTGAALWLAAPRAAAAAALVAGLIYAGLAGFALPTQRALVMLAVIMAGVILRRRLAPSTSLCLALAAVLVLDPFSVLSAGFWLSFGAVAVILAGMTGRVRGVGATRWQRWWWRWGRVQWLVSVGLLPLTIGWFLQYPLMAPFVNLLAVPWAGLVLVPLALAAAALLLPFPAMGAMVLHGARWAAHVMWQFLESVAGLDLILQPTRAPPALALLAACVGAALLIAPRGFPARILGAVWLLPLLLLSVPRPQQGAYWLTLLDVGQGLAAVVRTRSHVLIYDTGPSYGSGFDAGRDVLAPYLRAQGIARIDRLIISHAHDDHAGGAESLQAAWPATRVMTNVDSWRGRAYPCLRGERWSWDGVDFHILHPRTGSQGQGNDDSCVLQVSGSGGRLLLPGDLEERGEENLLAWTGERLRAEVLVVAHHGGRSSSGRALLDAVRPRMALIAVGYRNRHRFPHGEVLQRLDHRGVKIFDTATHGAISLKIGPGRGLQRPRLERAASRRIWRAR